MAGWTHKLLSGSGKENMRSAYPELGNHANRLRSDAEHGALKDQAGKTSQAVRSAARPYSERSAESDAKKIVEKMCPDGSSKDPVQFWTDYVRWTMAHQPHEQGEVLEKACGALAKDPQHRSDIRFLRLIVRLADTHPAPQQLLQAVEEKGVGTTHALLYEAWALCLEKHGRYAEADEIYSRGVKRNAQPLHRLRDRHHLFQVRMQKRIAKKEGRGIPGTLPEKASLEQSASAHVAGCPRPTTALLLPNRSSQLASDGAAAAAKDSIPRGGSAKRPRDESPHELVEDRSSCNPPPRAEGEAPPKRRRFLLWPFGSAPSTHKDLGPTSATEPALEVGSSQEVQAPLTSGDCLQDGVPRALEAVAPRRESCMEMDGLESLGQMLLEERDINGERASHGKVAETSDPSNFKTLGTMQVQLPVDQLEQRGSVTFFAVDVSSQDSTSSWRVMRRYSEFSDLAGRLVAHSMYPGQPEFPRKCLAACTGASLEQRRMALEQWLQWALRHPNSKSLWAEELRQFLKAPVDSNANQVETAHSSWSLSSWLPFAR
mmetsp:Transcript_136083/g.261396  ORF Transcript_136083/g.261396 Transcript_136083/m.261396 type:complete len:545 (-) Transcript_136083:125-1759(-)